MPTGNQLNMTITYTMVDYGDDDGVFYKAWSTSKTYTESNKDEYITEIIVDTSLNLIISIVFKDKKSSK